jgi:hypothetical protein
MQQKECSLTGETFKIRDKDLEFYKKISPVFNGKTCPIPAPTIHPKERERRRLAFRNERHLYNRKSSLSGRDIISNIHSASPYNIYSHDEWWSDNWNAHDYGRDFDFKRSFFEQFHELLYKVPRPPLINNKAENSDYCNYADGNKNCYLITTSNWNEDSYYGFLLVNNQNAVDSLWCADCQLIYQCIDCIKCYDVKYAQGCEQCVESSFLYDCRVLQNCLFCTNLKNKKYHIFNEPCSKEEYEQKVKEISGNYQKFQQTLVQFEELLKEKSIRKANQIVSSEKVSGNNIFNSTNIHQGFDIYECRDCAYVHDGLKAVDCYDVDYFDGTELCYESTSLIGYGYRFTMFCRDSYNLFYCDNCHSCKDCFGCIGLRNAKYCIFNKQFTKEEYENLVPIIIKHMQRTGEWGEYFPINLSPFAYNESLAQDDFPLLKEEALKRGYKWRDQDQREYKSSNVKIPNTIQEVPDAITKEMLSCKNCEKNYRIIPQELAFYQRQHIPIPRNCPSCRHQERMKQRNHRKLYDRKCSNCSNAIQTTYAPTSQETVYCEKCYLEAVY